MAFKHGTAAAALLALALPGLVLADDVRFVEQDGVTYRETRRIIRRPVSETRYQDTQRTVYREQVDVEMCESVRSYSVPVTEYQVESYWRGRFNPFMQPYLAQRVVPRTHWELRNEVVRVPVTRRRVVPETSTVQVPVTTLRTVDEEVISRIAVSPQRSSDPFARPATSEPTQVGGIANLDRSDPPRHGVPTPASSVSRMARGSGGSGDRVSSQWRPVDAARR